MLLFLSIITFVISPNSQGTAVGNGADVSTYAAKSSSLVNCKVNKRGKYSSKALFTLKNSVGSLLSWSLTFQQQLEKGKLTNADLNCEKALHYRGSAYCQGPGNAMVRGKLKATVDACHKALKRRIDVYCDKRGSSDCVQFKADYKRFKSWL
ncbi:hypothetical protein KKF84_16095 [Myxococcota bacterium]|nr:hypothetical protein [Myxococcota bacterium]MBU1536848.1 hypothetical protein [Myxococcota bacterium]